MGRHFSARVGQDVFERLEAQGRRSGQSRSAIAKQLLDERLWMEQHPGIVFRSGPGGRRAGLLGGPDVWEVVRALPGTDGGERTGLTVDQVGAALRYYAEYIDDVGDWMRRVEEEAERAEARWRREQALLGR